MKKLLLLCLMSGFALANLHFEKNQKCSECHPAIYAEYQKSQHGNATIYKDAIHGAVYNLHPQRNKKDKYRCAKCHTPTANNLKALLASNNGVMPNNSNETQNEAIACAYCHRITDTVAGKAMNKNIISTDPKKYFANLKSGIKSSFHEIETNKQVFKNGKLCMGCHMHKTNKKGFDVCSTEDDNMDGQNNCITCHMPKVAGAPSVMSKVKEHAYHGFPGLHGDLSLLTKYLGLDISVTDDKKMFTVVVDHKATHSTTLHPLRLAKLEVTVTRGNSTTKMKARKIFKKIGHKGKPTPPWLATEIIHDSRIPAQTKKAFPYAWELQSGDVITAKFGYLLVLPKALKKFDLQDNEEATKFRIINEKSFTVK